MTTAGTPNTQAAMNFSAGPAMLPGPVEEALQNALIDFEGTGISILSLSHRSERFLALMHSTQSKLRSLLGISDEYAVLWCGYAAAMHFSAIPLNLMSENGFAVYEMSGYWSDRAADEAEHYGQIWRFQAPFQMTPAAREEAHEMRQVMLGNDLPAYIYYCSNETIDGVSWPSLPDDRYKQVPIPIVADMTSDILSKRVDINAHGVIYASAQKNLGITGISLVIIRKDLLGLARSQTPRLMNYETLFQTHSIPNTANVLGIFAIEQMLIWVDQQGGLSKMEATARQRSDLLYSFIDSSSFYLNDVPHELRSQMNVPFALSRPDLTASFLAGAEARGLAQLQGHRSKGGVRASLYNAMPIQGVIRLTEWMREFENKHG
jgi:phosphoserine aminotransferase